MKEYRVCEIRAEQPPAEGTDGLIIKGIAIVYDKPATINDPKGQ